MQLCRSGRHTWDDGSEEFCCNGFILLPETTGTAKIAAGKMLRVISLLGIPLCWVPVFATKKNTRTG